jgi:hypothetical protein
VTPQPSPEADAATTPAGPETSAATTPPKLDPPAPVRELVPTYSGVPPAVAELPPTARPEPLVVTTATPAERTDPWAKLIEDPGHAPELLALAAVQTLGPRAAVWIARTRDAYPTADNAALARLATKQFTRFGGLGSTFGAAAGSYAPVALLGSASITQAELSLHLAAAYGLEPTDPQRAADLLVIARVHQTLADAEAAIAAARRPSYDEAGLSEAAWRLGRMMAAQTGGWALVRLANRFFPGAGLLAAVLAGTASAQGAAARANSHYRQIQASGWA